MRMRKCPFCKQEVKPIFPAMMFVGELGKWSFLHNCNDKTAILIHAATKEEVIAEWNGSEDDAEEQKSESL